MESRNAATVFAALSQETRVRAFRLLRTVGDAGLAAGELSSRLAVPASTLSFHLAALEQAGLIDATRQGRQTIYRANAARLRELLAIIDGAEADASPAPSGPPPVRVRWPAPSSGATSVVLFLCHQNSARSIMAESILGKIGEGRFRAYSAGTQPAASPLPQVLRKLESLGHDVSGLRSKSWMEFTRPGAAALDFVITLCDLPPDQPVPSFPAHVVTGAWPLPDPAKFVGSELERSALLNELYDGIRRRLELFCGLPFAALDRAAATACLDAVGGTPARAH